MERKPEWSRVRMRAYKFAAGRESSVDHQHPLAIIKQSVSFFSGLFRSEAVHKDDCGMWHVACGMELLSLLLPRTVWRGNGAANGATFAAMFSFTKTCITYR